MVDRGASARVEQRRSRGAGPGSRPAAVIRADLIDLLLCFGQPATPPCDTGQDVNTDGTVNVLDLIDVLLDFGAVCP